MDRLPKPAPFPVGTKVRYLGTLRTWADPEGKDAIIFPGMEATIVSTVEGRRGTLREIEVDDDDEPIVDHTTDGRSVYVSRGRRLIAHAHEWVAVND